MEKRSIARIKKSKERRSRSGSCGNIEEMWKRKRKESGKGGEGEEEAFSGSKKTVRPPYLKNGMGRGIEDEKANERN